MRPKSAFGVFLVIIGLIGLYYVFTNEGKSPLEAVKNYFTDEVYEQQTVDLNDISNLDVESGSLDVNVVPGRGSEAVLTLQGRASKNVIKNIDFTTEKNNDTLYVTLIGDQSFKLRFNWSNIKLTIELPEQAWNELNVQVGSGDIRIDKQQFASAEIQADSGDIEVNRITVDDRLALKVGSGDIELKDVTSHSLELETDSGDIEAERYTSEQISFSVGSGDVSFEDGTGAITGEASSGDISLHADELLYDTDLTTGSGNVTVSLKNDPDSLGVTFSAGSGDGRIRLNGFSFERGSNGDDEIAGAFGAGEIKLNVQTGSGDFVLK